MGQRRGSRYVRSWKDQIAIFVAACMLTHRVGNCMHGPSRPRGVDTAICINVILYFFCLTFCCRPPSHERGSGSLLQTPRPSAAPCQNRDPRSSPTGEATCKRGLRPPPQPHVVISSGGVGLGIVTSGAFDKRHSEFSRMTISWWNLSVHHACCAFRLDAPMGLEATTS